MTNQYSFQHVYNLLFLKIGAKLAKAKTKMLHFQNVTNESFLQTRIHRDLWGWGGEGSGVTNLMLMGRPLPF